MIYLLHPNFNVHIDPVFLKYSFNLFKLILTGEFLVNTNIFPIDRLIFSFSIGIPEEPRGGSIYSSPIGSSPKMPF